LVFIISLALSVLFIQRAVESFNSLAQGQDGAKSYVVDADGRVEVVAKRRPAAERVEAVTAAPKHPEGTILA
jgi:hypothetical protein